MDGKPSWKWRYMGWEVAGDVPAPKRDPAAPFEMSVSPPHYRFPDTTRSEDSCAMCGHRRALHTTATDGAGWCAFPESCDCGGFPGRLW